MGNEYFLPGQRLTGGNDSHLSRYAASILHSAVENSFNYLGLHIFSARIDSQPKHAIVVSMLVIRYDC
jgi:hypothetical protein